MNVPQRQTPWLLNTTDPLINYRSLNKGHLVLMDIIKH